MKQLTINLTDSLWERINKILETYPNPTIKDELDYLFDTASPTLAPPKETVASISKDLVNSFLHAGITCWVEQEEEFHKKFKKTMDDTRKYAAYNQSCPPKNRIHSQ